MPNCDKSVNKGPIKKEKEASASKICPNKDFLTVKVI